jgi:peptidylprolyl isomerase
MIKKGDTVAVHYTGKFLTGEVFDTSEGREPITFTVGESQVIKGFEDAVIGKLVGDKISATIPAAEGYGELREDLIIDIPKDNVPPNVEVGSVLSSVSPEGQPFTVTVKEIKEEAVTVDMNHHMAGKDMVFDIEVVSIS